MRRFVSSRVTAVGAGRSFPESGGSSVLSAPARRVTLASVRRLATAAGGPLPSFTAGLFRGELAMGSLHPYPVQDVLSEEQRSSVEALVAPVNAFFERDNDAEANDKAGAIPPSVMEGLQRLGAYGLQVPEEYGGVALSTVATARMVEVVGSHDLAVGIHLGAHQSIGYKGIVLFGTPEQKKKYLPGCAAGTTVAAFALTEPSAGSDAASVRTKAVKQADGSWRLTGSKIWISNGGYASVFTVFARTEEGMTAFIVERAFGGLTCGPPEDKMGIKASNTVEVFLDNVPVPAGNVLGRVGGGFKTAMAILNAGRFGLGATLTGTMKVCLRGAVEHATRRVQFDGRTISQYGLIQSKLASMAAHIYGTESLVYALASNLDRGGPTAVSDFKLEAAVSKIKASEAADAVCDETIQILGGLGFMRSLPYARISNDLRIFRIFEGTNEILRLLVGGGGLGESGKALAPLHAALKAPLSNLGTLLPAGLEAAGLAAREAVGLPPSSASLSLSWVPSALRPASEVLERGTASFGPACRALLLRHGSAVVEQQTAVAAAADFAIDATVLASALSRASRAAASRSPTASHERDLVLLLALLTRPRMEEAVERMRAASGVAPAQGTALASAVADATCKAGGYGATPPVGF